MAKKAFNLGDYLKESMDASHAGPARHDEQIVRIPLEMIDPNPDNFYSLEGLEDLAANIELVGLLDALRVRPASLEHVAREPARRDEGGRYIVVSGHRRRAACMMIRDGGNPMFDAGIPCIVEYGEASPAMRELRLIYANSATRVMSAADLSRQAERVTELLYQLKEQGVEFPGRMRDHVAQACQVSASKIARLHAIRSNLDPALLQIFDTQPYLINETAAYELQRLPKEAQEYLGTQKKILNNGVSGDRAAEMAKRSNTYLHPKCRCPDGSACSHTLPRFKQTASAGLRYHTCSGGCCLDCDMTLSNCPYQCPQARAKLEAEKDDRKAEEEKAQEREKRRQARVLEKVAPQYAKLLALAEKAGLDDKDRIWLACAGTVADLRQRAAGEGFYGWQLRESLTPVGGMLAEDLAKTADLLGVTVDFLLGREPKAAMSKLDTAAEAAWQTGTPQRNGRYYCRIRFADSPEDGGRVHEQRGEWRDGGWWFFGEPEKYGIQVVGWWPLPDEERWK